MAIIGVVTAAYVNNYFDQKLLWPIKLFKHRKSTGCCTAFSTVPNTLPHIAERKCHVSENIMHQPRQLFYRTVAATIMSTMYGHDVLSSTDDSYVKRAEQSVAMLSDVLLPGAAIMNAIPALRYLPAWLPGVDFKRLALGVKELTQELQDAPINFVKKGIVRFYD
jgi:hypothetical protein